MYIYMYIISLPRKMCCLRVISLHSFFFPPQVLFIHIYLLSHWVINWMFGFPYPWIFLKIHWMLWVLKPQKCVTESCTEWMSLTNQPMGKAHFNRKVLFSVKLGKHKISRLLSLWTSSVCQLWMTTSHVCIYIAHKLVEIIPTMQFYILFYLTLLLSMITVFSVW